jgi:hypothetical protein
MTGLVLAVLLTGLPAEDRASPEERALAYLAREVPSWAAKNKCYSCHNNADAVRALYKAKRLQMAVPPKALDDTSHWLTRPMDWAHNGGEGPFNDKVLARIQFAATLLDGIETKLIDDRNALVQAARLVAEQQTKDGSWRIGDGESIGSPATLGNYLATVYARRVLFQADAKGHHEAIVAADRWLRKVAVKNVLDAAALLMALADAKDDEAIAQRRRCLALIRKGEAKDGGWGPYITSAPEPFDTAVVVLALVQQKDQRDVADLARRGRAFLITAQAHDGNWKETTRPAGGDSYAQRISTTGWATQALLATRPQ